MTLIYSSGSQGKTLKDYIGVISEKKEKHISFNVNINVKMAGVTNKDGKEIFKNIQLISIDISDLWNQVQINWQAIYVIQMRFSVISAKKIWS